MARARLLTLVTIGFALALSTSGGAVNDPEHKVDVCHIPPGNPANAHMINVDQAAVPAHLAHGDTLGDETGGCGGVISGSR